MSPSVDPTSAAVHAPAASPEVEPGIDPIDLEAASLIDVYFELEEPVERDALFEQLVALDSPIVTDFLLAMLEEDEDEFVRAAAAAELARRGSPEGIAALQADLNEPDELFFFEQAVTVLVGIHGTAFYEPLAGIWRDVERDADERRVAMLGLETADPTRALADFVAWIDSVEDPATLADDQLEVAMAAFVRHAHAAAVPALQALRLRLAQAANMDPEEREELRGFVQEGLELLGRR